MQWWQIARVFPKIFSSGIVKQLEGNPLHKIPFRTGPTEKDLRIQLTSQLMPRLIKDSLGRLLAGSKVMLTRTI